MCNLHIASHLEYNHMTFLTSLNIVKPPEPPVDHLESCLEFIFEDVQIILRTHIIGTLSQGSLAKNMYL